MARTVRFDNRSTYEVEGERGKYLVTLFRLNNDINGNPRWEANVICPGVDYRFTAVYRFGGHYYNEQDEAKWIVAHYEKENYDEEDTDR